MPKMWSEDCEFTSVWGGFCFLTGSVTIMRGICGIMDYFSTEVIFMVWPRCTCKSFSDSSTCFIGLPIIIAVSKLKL